MTTTLNGFTFTDDGWIITPSGSRLRVISGGGGSITGSSTGDTALLTAAAVAATAVTMGAAAPAVPAAVGTGTAAGAGAGALGGMTAAELGAAGMTIADASALGVSGAEIAAATPSMGAIAGAGLPTGATVASAPTWWSANVAPYIPSKETLGTFQTYNTAGQLGGSAFAPQPAKAPPAPPSVPSGATGRFTPAATSPAQTLAGLMAQRRQSTAGRRFV